MVAIMMIVSSRLGWRWARRLPALGALLIGALLASGGPALAAKAGATGPAVGDHWHMATGIWNCGKWEPAPAPGDDPIGIHTHGDGLIHIHPFVPAAAGANATLVKFFEVEKITLSAKEIVLPTKTLKAGTSCKGSNAVVRTLWWDNRKAASPKTLTSDPSKIALKDQAIVVLAFGPKDEVVGFPPSLAELEDPADLPPPPLPSAALKTLPAPPASIPTATMTGNPPKALKLTDRVVGSGKEVSKGTRPYVRFAAYLWRTGELLDKSSWIAGEQPTALGRIGKSRTLPGIDRGLIGLKVGGIREIVLPPNEAFGPEGSPPVLGTDTIVMVFQLVEVTK